MGTSHSVRVPSSDIVQDPLLLSSIIPRFVQIETVTGFNIEIERGTKSRARTGTEIDNGTGSKIECETGSRIEGVAGIEIGNSTGIRIKIRNNITIRSMIHQYKRYKKTFLYTCGKARAEASAIQIIPQPRICAT
ncbi:hypothetical protein EVAR_18862_1 [Eumeta japonica]|uniref:Uncharacterized protein n=1 Tax=Eumeta variegata TaxID=151549 RepID=A0A4C1ULT6_EUMVA|nr:hypothetical protein EVAR_18862_1 [Eumeta japonica]